MTDLAPPFARSRAETIGVAFLCSRLRYSQQLSEAIYLELGLLNRQGWLLSVQEMLSGNASPPYAYDISATSGLTLAGLFEAPSIADALEGIDRLDRAGWSELLATQWLIGPREFAPVGEPTRDTPWGFIALWQWNDAWCDATLEERLAYDAECDIAFRADLAAGIAISGRHRVDLTSPWHQLAVWDAPSFQSVSEAMCMHERVADFRFTTSRHYVGQRRPLAHLLGVSHG